MLLSLQIFRFFKFYLHIFLNFFIFYSIPKGSELSSESRALYQTKIQNFENIIEIIFGTTFKLTALAHVVPFLCPLLYVSVGFPSPDWWFTPFSVHEL